MLLSFLGFESRGEIELSEASVMLPPFLVLGLSFGSEVHGVLHEVDSVSSFCACARDNDKVVQSTPCEQSADSLQGPQCLGCGPSLVGEEELHQCKKMN